MKTCVYCASSDKTDSAFGEDARRLGELLALEGIEIIYGGGAVGSMGQLADGALAQGGRVVGIIPSFMMAREWGHPQVTELRVVPDMHTRKQMMMEEADAIVALPGGSGTWEELLEAITWKRLALLTCPIVIVNFRGYYDSLVRLLEQSVREKFMSPAESRLWTVVGGADEVLAVLA